MIACLCHAVSEQALREAAAAGRSAEEVARATGAGTSCGTCAEAIAGILSGREACDGGGVPCPGCPGLAA
jgi:bacterioferritin-associated ferredoxin